MKQSMYFVLIVSSLLFIITYFLPQSFFTFLLISLSLVSLSLLLSDAIEKLSSYIPYRINAFLNATLGNIAELIIAIVAVRAGKIDLVKGALIGSVLGNILVVPGLAMFFGGIKHGRQQFSTEAVAEYTTMMSLSVVGLLVPTLFEILHEAVQQVPYQLHVNDPRLNAVSIGVAIVLLLVYILGVIFTLSTTPLLAIAERKGKKESDLLLILGMLVFSSILLVFASDMFIRHIHFLTASLGLHEIFLSVILVPFVSNIVEHSVAVQQGYKNNMNFALSLSMESSAQIVLFLTPILVLVSALFRPVMTLFFNPLEVAILGISIFIAIQITFDGESNWIEGIQLIAIYLLAAIGFLFY